MGEDEVEDDDAAVDSDEEEGAEDMSGPPGSVDRCFAPIFFARFMQSIVCWMRISPLSSIQEG